MIFIWEIDASTPDNGAFISVKGSPREILLYD